MRRPGFTIPGYAARAGRKAHELGVAHKWTSDEAKQAAKAAADKRQALKRVCNAPEPATV